MIRKAEAADIAAVAAIYEKIIAREERGEATIGWMRDVYPTRVTAEEALGQDELYVDCEQGRVVSAARINRVEDPAYALAHWGHALPENGTLVLHTLVVDPDAAGRGLGKRFVAFYEQTAREQGVRELRMDTNAINKAARTLYSKLGYTEADIVSCSFHGMHDIRLVCLEKYLAD